MLKEHIQAPITEATSDVYTTLQGAREAQARVENVFQRHGCPEQRMFEVRMCLEEALVNTIRHGNKDNPDASALVQSFLYELPEPTVLEICEKAGKAVLPIQKRVSHLVHVIVCDEGQGDFRLDNIPDPTAPENLEKGSGRGIKCLIFNFALDMRIHERTSWPDDSGRSGGQIEMVFGFEDSRPETQQKEEE